MYAKFDEEIHRLIVLTLTERTIIPKVASTLTYCRERKGERMRATKTHQSRASLKSEPT